MKKEELIVEIEKLPPENQLYIAEKILSHLRQTDTKYKMMKAAEKLESEYETNDELTSFTRLDTEDFYEAR